MLSSSHLGFRGFRAFFVRGIKRLHGLEYQFAELHIVSYVHVHRGSIYTTYGIRPPKKPSLFWFWGPNSIMVVHMDPLGMFITLD